jgi:hypothetical protein
VYHHFLHQSSELLIYIQKLFCDNASGKQVLVLVAAPLLFLFSLLRALAFQLWVVLGIVICRSRSAIPSRSRWRQNPVPVSDAESGDPAELHNSLKIVIYFVKVISNSKDVHGTVFFPFRILANRRFQYR